jgi:hypothetical protein
MALRLSLALFVCLAAARPASGEGTFFRVFLVDGSSVVSYGEMARVFDQVVFSMPVGGSFDDPRLHAVTLASTLVDWPRTERHAASTRYLKYFEERAEADYERLTTDVAGILNRIAQTNDRASALALAEQARRTLADWPRTHYGYRQNDVRDIVTLLDQSISRLRGTGTIELSLFATVDPIPLEPIALTPSRREQVEQIQRVVRLTTNARDRVALLQSGLSLVSESGDAIEVSLARTFKRSFETQLKNELAIDARYTRLTERVLARASRAAANARVSDVERTLAGIDRDDERLGRKRPEVVQALKGSVQAYMDAARRFRLLRDQWEFRRDLYRGYEHLVGAQMARMARAQPTLEAIRRLDGPSPADLSRLRSDISGGAERLDRLLVHEQLQEIHQLLTGAWRFAEAAARGRYDAISSGNLSTAWEASSAAAGALLMLSRAQQQLRVFLEPPSMKEAR